MKKLTAAVLILCLLLCSCAKQSPVQVKSTVSEDTKFKGAIVALSQEEFENAGFKLGDSVDIVFESGYEITDVPYYNGYYVKNEAPVVVAYPGFTTLRITYNNIGIWDKAGLSDGEEVTISLNEAGKYSAVQETLGQIYSTDRSQYGSDEEFCNFRALSGGNLKPDFLYRGASPVDNSRGRAAYTDGILEAYGISFVIDLADSAEDMDGYLSASGFASPYSAQLYQNGGFVLLDMGSSFQSAEYQQKVAEGMKAILSSDGPVYIHCMEGKDRTGFVSMLLEALCGASYDEMLSDYMITYANYYSVTKDGTPEKYDAIAELYFDAFVEYLHGTSDKAELKAADYTVDARAYLIAGGMTDEEVDRLIAMISVR